MQAPTQLLADRYRFKQSLDLGAKSIAWIAVDERTQREVVASALPTARVAALMGVVGLRHPHLAGILDVVHDPDPAMIPGGAKVRAAGIVVAELVRGTSLHQAVKKGALPPRAAVASWLGLCEAVRSMHQVGGAHGAISPRSIVVEPAGGREGPVLTQLLAPSSGAYCAPERLQGRGPSTADDVWALHAALFAALTGSPPFKGDTKDQLVLSMASGRMQALADFGLYEPALQLLLEQGLTADLTRRRSEIALLLQALHTWLEAADAVAAGPPLLAPDARDWDEEAATAVQNEAELAASISSKKPPAPVFSMPPVPVPDESGDEGHDEEDATTVMHGLPAAELEAALRTPYSPPSYEPYEAEEDPYPSPKEMVIPTPATFDDQTLVDRGRQLAPSEPPTAIMSREMLAGAQAPAPPAPPAPQSPSAFPESRPLSAFPPPISRPPPAGLDLAQMAAATDDIAVRKAGRGPLIVIFVILLLVGLGIGIALFLNYRSAPMGRGDLEVKPQPSAPVARATQSAEPRIEGEPILAPGDPTGTPLPQRSSGPSLAAMVSAATGATEGPACVTAHFAPGSFKPNEKFEFLCKQGDFRGIASQLHRRLVVAGVGKVTPAMKEWATFGWYELAAAAVIRSSCCTAADAQIVDLPKTPGPCGQLSDALMTIAKRPTKREDVPARSAKFQETVECLFSNGIPRPYSYKARPSDPQRKAFEAFFERTVERRRG